MSEEGNVRVTVKVGYTPIEIERMRAALRAIELSQVPIVLGGEPFDWRGLDETIERRLLTAIAAGQAPEELEQRAVEVSAMTRRGPVTDDEKKRWADALDKSVRARYERFDTAFEELKNTPVGGLLGFLDRLLEEFRRDRAR